VSYPTEGDRRRDELLRAQAGLTMPKPAAWRPETEGESIAGHLVRVDHGEQKYGVYPILVLADERGVEHAVWLYATVLRVQVEELGPQIGDAVAIVYEGRRTPKGGGDEYHAYKVSLAPAAGSQIDWGNGGRRVAAIPQDQLEVEKRPDPEPPEPPGGPDASPGPGGSTDFPGTPRGRGDTITTWPAQVDLLADPEACPYCGLATGFHEQDCLADPPPWP
jgi:hypothetical protein